MASFNPRESPVVFLAVWSLSTVLYKSIGGYWSSVITTVEKIFHLSTSQSGFLTVLDYFAGLWVIMPLVYIGQFCHRPRFMAVITILTSLGTLVQTFPHFLYQTSLEEFLNGKGSDDLSSGLCGGLNDSLVDSTEPECKRGDVLSLLTGPAVWLVIGRIMTCSYGSVFPIALVYVDDVVAKKSIVLYTGFIISLYTVGFTCGYFLASLCLRIPYVLFTTDVEVESDKLPGAWWLGYLILSILTFLSSLLYFVFPTALPVHVNEEGGESKPLLSVDEGALPSNQARGDNFVSNPSVVGENIKQTDASFTDGLQRFWEGTKAFCRSVYRIVTNPVIILMSLMGGIFTFGSEAFATFTPLYVQNHFNITPSVASMLTGIQTFFGYTVGQLLGAILIRHWNLNKLQCAIFYLVGVTLFCLGPTASVFFSCPDEKIIGHNEHTVSTNSFSNGVDLLDCNANCGCSGDFSPVCGIDGFSYMSPCHAGCREFLFSNDQAIFYDCSCVNPSPSVKDYYDNNRELQEGLCSEVCPTWIYYAVVWVISLFILSAASNAPVIIILRSVAEEDRALTFIFINWVKRVLGFIPGPLISGIIIDQACLISSNSCGSGPSSGNCLLYDKQMLRKRYYILPVVCFWLSCIFSVMITIIVWRQTKQQDRKRDETPQIDETSAM